MIGLAAIAFSILMEKLSVFVFVLGMVLGMYQMKNFYTGTSGWSYKHWKGVFYPKDCKPQEYLEYYTEYFHCVELNASFYRLPSRKTILDWKKRTPEDFTFCPKLSRYITHIKKLHDARDALSQFLDLFRGMKKKLGPILVQLPQNVHFHNPNIEEFCSLLRKFKSFQFALEARHQSWHSKDAETLLSEKNIAWVISDSGGRYPSKEMVTADHVYLRFHGPGNLYASNYSSTTLKKYAKKTKKWLSEGKKVWAFFNNDAKGYAVKNAQQFRKFVE